MNPSIVFLIFFITLLIILAIISYNYLNSGKENIRATFNQTISNSNSDNVAIQNISGNGNNSIQINGKTFSGNSVSIINGEVIIDGKKQTNLSDFEEKIINVTINGNVESVSTSNGDITISGVVKNNVKNVNGSIDIGGDVSSSITSTNGNVTCNNVSGDIDTTNGNIKYRK